MSAYDDLFGGNALLQSNTTTNHNNTSNTSLMNPSSLELNSINTTLAHTLAKKKGSKSSLGGEKVNTTARRIPVIPASWTQRYQSNAKPTPPTVVKAKVTVPTLSKTTEKILSSLDKRQEEQQKNLSTVLASEELSLSNTSDVTEKNTEKLPLTGKKKIKKSRGTNKSYYEETYDPSRPNDYEAYKKWRKEIHSARHPVTLPEHPSHPDTLVPPGLLSLE